MYAITHSRLAKKVPSQNPPSNVNVHIFSNHRFLTGRYPYHQARVASNMVSRSYITFCVQLNTNETGFATRFKLTPQL